MLEWISYERFNYNIEYIAEDKLEKVYKAKYNYEIINTMREELKHLGNKSEFIALVILNDLSNIKLDILEFIDKVINQLGSLLLKSR